MYACTCEFAHFPQKWTYANTCVQLCSRRTYYMNAGQVRVSFRVGEPSPTAPYGICEQVATLGTSFRRTHISLWEIALCLGVGEA